MPDPTPDPNATPAPAATPTGGTPAPTPAPVDPQAILDAVKALGAKVEGIEARFTQPAPAPAQPAAPAIPDEIDAEINLRKQQLAQIRSGQLAPEYEPEVQAALAGAMARKEGRGIVEREGIRGSFVQEYNASLAQAYSEFPDLKDANSELHKETLKVLNADRSYRAVQVALNAKGRDAEKINFGMLDPEVTLKAAYRAQGIITKRNGGKPISQTTPSNPRAPNAALEAGAGAAPIPGDDEIAKLEAKASGPDGTQDDWLRVIKARENRQRGLRAAGV
jgi:hypothetical protein